MLFRCCIWIQSLDQIWREFVWILVHWIHHDVWSKMNSQKVGNCFTISVFIWVSKHAECRVSATPGYISTYIYIYIHRTCLLDHNGI